MNFFRIFYVSRRLFGSIPQVSLYVQDAVLCKMSQYQITISVILSPCNDMGIRTKHHLQPPLYEFKETHQKLSLFIY